MRPTATITVSFPWGETVLTRSVECDLSMSAFHPIPETSRRGAVYAANRKRQRRLMAEMVAAEIAEGILESLDRPVTPPQPTSESPSSC